MAEGVMGRAESFELVVGVVVSVAANWLADLLLAVYAAFNTASAWGRAA